MGSRGQGQGPKVTQGVKGLTFRVPGGQGVGLQDPTRSKGRPAGSQGVKREV